MRAFAGGYYSNLQAMYDHLNVSYHSQPFLFEFAKVTRLNKEETPYDDSPYFIHSSNNHIFPPIRPSTMSILEHIVEMMYLLLCYAWYTVCCLLVSPRHSRDGRLCETYMEYLERLRLPRYFVDCYLLPLMSAVTTCSHQAVLRFPAKDLIEYKKKTHNQPHFTVSKGVREVQEKLAVGLNVQLRSRVYEVANYGADIRVRWIESENNKKETKERIFDHVIFAVPPNVVGSLFAPLSSMMARIPTIQVRSIVTKRPNLKERRRLHQIQSISSKSQKIRLVNWFEGEGWTQSDHEQTSGLIVTTCPLKDPTQANELHSATFTRVLRTPESRDIVNTIFDCRKSASLASKTWMSGDGGIWLVGGWCWDGMVLLEGCVSSAMKVADSLEVDIPWSDRVVVNAHINNRI